MKILAALTLSLAVAASAQDEIPPAPMPDLEAPAESLSRTGSEAAPVKPLTEEEEARARVAASNHLRHVRGGSQDGAYALYDPQTRKTLRLMPEPGDQEVFAAAEGAVVRVHFRSKDGERVALDIPLRAAGSSWEPLEPRIWRVGDQLRYYYDLGGRVVPMTGEAPPESWWQKLLPWLK